MPSFQNLAAIAAFLPISLALPAASPNTKPRGFSVANIVNPEFAGHNGKAALRKSTAKWGTSLLQTTTTTTATTASQANPKGNTFLASPGDADANPIDATDLEYLTPVTIGGKQYLLDLDTGSSNLWIGGANTQAKDKYVPSGTALPGTWTISYGDQSSASGDIFKETVTIGGTTATDVVVGRATVAPSSFFLPGANNRPGADGLLGLGFSKMSTFPNTPLTWFDSAVAQGLPNIFAADLRFGLDAGSYDFGRVNPALYTGDITYVDVVKADDPSQQYWMIQPTEGDKGVMDTGTTLMLLAAETTKAYYSSPAAVAAGARNNGGQWEYKCNSTLPDFSVGFGDNQALVPGSYLNYQDLGNGYCYSAIQDRDPSMSFSIYGDRFLMTLYVVFDQTSGSPRVGFAAKSGK